MSESWGAPRYMRTVTIPKGTPIHSMKDGWITSGRALTRRVEVRTYEGDPERGRPEWEVTTWPGPGGYWRRTYKRDGEYVQKMPS